MLEKINKTLEGELIVGSDSFRAAMNHGLNLYFPNISSFDYSPWTISICNDSGRLYIYDGEKWVLP